MSHIGIYRDHETLQPVEYYFKAPADLSDRLTIVVDPMLATGNSSIAAVDKLKERGARDIRFVCLLAAPEGIKNFTDAHPDVPVFTAAIDSHLNEKGYIVARSRRCRRPHVRYQVSAALVRTKRSPGDRPGLFVCEGRDYSELILMMAGAMMTANRTGRKKTIIGTVSLGGNAAAFFSASFIRMSRFSWLSTRKVWPSGVP